MNDKVLINVGCGSKNYLGFVNVDAVSAPHVDVVTNDLSKLPFDSNHADLIYMCHVLEHVKMNELNAVLVEMHRVLKVGGILRISVPGFDELIAFYKRSGGNIDSILLQLMGGQNHEYNFHYSVFNARRLANLLDCAGFNIYQIWDPERCEHHDFTDRASRDISLNMEGIK
jgi:SAM-dependent methyltransferase